MNRASAEILRFLKSHRAHIVLIIPGAIVVTAFHETAHCVAVWLQGGSVTSFVFLPSGGKWGEMRYTFPTGVPYNDSLIAVAPYITSLTLCLAAAILSMRNRQWAFPVASTIFVWLFIVPAADIANAAIPYLLRQANNDLLHAFGAVKPLASLLAVTVGVLLIVAGYWIQIRLYRDRAIRLPAYVALAFAGFFMILLVTTF